MTGAYVPQADTIGGRALAHLQKLPPGTEVPSGPLADALGVNSSMINVCLDTAAKHGVMVRDKREGRIYWRLGPNAPAPDRHAADEDTADAPDLAVKQLRVDASTAAAPIDGLAQQSWCPVAQDLGDASSLDEPAAPPPPSPAPPPLGLGWRAPRVPVYRGEAPVAAPEPGPAAVLNDAPTQDDDPDFQEVRRAPAPPELDTPPKGAEAAQAPVPPCGRDVATPNNGDVSQGRASAFRCALWSDGSFHIELYPGNFMLLTKAETRQLVAYLERMAESSE